MSFPGKINGVESSGHIVVELIIVKNLLGPIQKRDILYGVKKHSSQELVNISDDFKSEGWLSDALDFAHQAGDSQRIQKIRDESVETGQVFLFLKSSRFLGDPPEGQSLLKQCAENAERAGKIRYAIMAFEKLGDNERVSKLKEKIQGDLDQVAEQNAQANVFIPEHSEELEGAEQE